MQELKAKREVLRKCSVCGEHREKRELMRVVRTPEGEVMLDLKGKTNGRGAYLCRSEKCLVKAKKSNRIGTLLSSHIPDSVYDEIAALLSEDVK